MKEKILIYEDDKDIIILCKTVLSQHGFETESREVCENIFDDIESVVPNLILMDLWIPGIGGEKAIDMVKKNDKTKHIPVLVFSANSDIEEIGIKVKADGFVKKPFTITDFVQTIRGHLQ
ncbi:response regulator [Cryomorpha ignava]|uniref:Response regulator n=1 Tax=Cryomorpha ignava TaxID=101383 RepID=A0A7K3WSU0_9FLAO|nr:response regulator [Cryomorpha ignava]NEN24757.1 response regulator [Cryomorpha ignava]